MPLAIWKHDPSGNRKDTWEVQIEQRKGPDNYRIDPETKRPVSGSDGIPEITLRSFAKGMRPESCNLQVLDIGTQFDDEKVCRQLKSGWSEDDLQYFGGMLNLSGGIQCPASPELLSRERDALGQLNLSLPAIFY